MPPDLVIPPAIDELVHEFDSKESNFNELDVQQALNNARASLVDSTEGENFGAGAEALAFTLITNGTGGGPWGTYFVPVGSLTDRAGKVLYSPDIASADDQVIAHWIYRAKTVKHPVLKARYADLAWEMCWVIAKIRRDPEMARLAIDSYLASIEASIRRDLHEKFIAAVRAFDLASLIHDKDRAECARKTLLGLHREAINIKQGWWLAFDRLVLTKNTGITDDEKQEIVDSLERLILHFGDTSNPASFDPHALQAAASRLIQHYTRLQQRTDIQRLNVAIARAFEHFASLGDAMLASRYCKLPSMPIEQLDCAKRARAFACSCKKKSVNQPMR
jgi:lysyl-tRNA synthetase class 1